MRKTVYNIGSRIRECRKAKHWTQKELALRIGTSNKYLSHVENGVKFPSLEMLICLSRELDVSLDYLISSGDCPVPAGPEDLRSLFPGCSEEEYVFLTDIMAYIHQDMIRFGLRIR